MRVGLIIAYKEEGPWRQNRQGPSFERSRWLQRANVGGLQAFGAFGHLELHRLAVIQGFVTFALDGREVNEHVLRTTFRGDETKPLGCVEPFHCTFH